MFGAAKRIWIPACAFVLFSAVIAIHAWHYMPFLADDSLISLRYARRFLLGEGLTWTDGPPVEGYSNLLWILAVACLGSFGIDLIDATRILGVGGMCVVVLSVLLTYRHTPESRHAWLPLVTGLLFFSLAAPIAVWSIGGLEQPLYCALLGIALPLCFIVVESNAFKPIPTGLASFTLGLMGLTRPDGLIFTAAVIAVVILTRRASENPRRIRTVLVLLSCPVLFYGMQTSLLWRIGVEHRAGQADALMAPSERGDEIRRPRSRRARPVLLRSPFFRWSYPCDPCR